MQGRGFHGRAMALAAAAALLALSGCETRYEGTPPLREVRTEKERLYVRCLANDPLFVTVECRPFGGKNR